MMEIQKKNPENFKQCWPESTQASVDDSLQYHVNFTKSYATRFNHVLEADILDVAHMFLPRNTAARDHLSR